VPHNKLRVLLNLVKPGLELISDTRLRDVMTTAPPGRSLTESILCVLCVLCVVVFTDSVMLSTYPSAAEQNQCERECDHGCSTMRSVRGDLFPGVEGPCHSSSCARYKCLLSLEGRLKSLFWCNEISMARCLISSILDNDNDRPVRR
jgi:hypothetical protein